ncbi:recombination protein NinG [Buttiauxella sp. A111]|uniref:recombination protein NinG n=1 Tax=Buttiauxella sp. A111 TaxID=2563088 RepID=UPI0010E0217B|nr:recombination protein NinG [Buttiauxella sp. A111]GDX06663.1 recombination protein NinG [Buttiauxella sp. A111]
MAKQPRRKCKVCREWFHPSRNEQIVCSYECASSHGKAVNDAAKAEAQRRAKQQQRKKDKEGRRLRAERRLAVQPLNYFKRQAQQAFNEYIRYRDKGLPCISCGRFHDGQYHAGHFRTTGSNPELRFNEDNCHRQCAPCNNHLSGNLTAYRPALIAKIGQTRFDELMGPHELPNWKREDYILIRGNYRAKLKELKQQEVA